MKRPAAKAKASGEMKAADYMDLVRENLKDPTYARLFWQRALKSGDETDIGEAFTLIREVLGKQKAAALLQPAPLFPTTSPALRVRNTPEGSVILQVGGRGHQVKTVHDVIDALNTAVAAGRNGKRSHTKSTAIKRTLLESIKRGSAKSANKSAALRGHQ